MAITPIDTQNLNDRIAELQESKVLSPYSGNPTAITTLAVLLNALEASSGSSTTLTASGVEGAIDGSLDIETIKTILGAIDSKVDLTAIRSALTALVTASTKRFTGTIFQDSTQTYYLNRYDENAGTFSNINLATGAVYVPIPPVRMPDGGDSHLVSQKSYQVVGTVAPTPFYDPGEELTKITSKVAGNTVVVWLNDSRGTEIPIVSAPPAIDVKPIEDYEIELLQVIQTQAEQAIGVFLDGAYAGTTYYKAITDDNASNQWRRGDIITRRNATSGGASGAGVNWQWYNESQGQPAMSPQPIFNTDIEQLDTAQQRELIDFLHNWQPATNSTLFTAPNNITPGNSPTSRDVGAGIVGLDVFVQNTNPIQVNLSSVPTVTVDSLPALNVSNLPPVSISTLPGNIQADIAAIAVNTAKISIYDFTLAQDSTGVTFFIRTNKTTGASNNVRIDTGAAFSPIFPIEMTDPIISDRFIEINEYDAITVSAGNWTAPDILTRVRVIVPSTGAIVSTVWQKADGSVLATIPVIGVDVEDTNKTAINTATATLNAVGNFADVTVPGSVTTPATLKGLLRVLWNAVIGIGTGVTNVTANTSSTSAAATGINANTGLIVTNTNNLAASNTSIQASSTTIQNNTNATAVAANNIAVNTANTVSSTTGTTNAVVAGVTSLLAAIANGFDVAKSVTAGGAAPTTARLLAGIYNAVLPTLTTGQSAALQTDANGRLIVTGTLSGGGGSTPGDLFVTGGAAAFNANTNILLPVLAATEYDTMIVGSNATYRSAFVEITASAGVTSGSIIFEGTNNPNATWTAVPFWDESIAQLYNQPVNAISIAASTVRPFQVPIKYRYIRCRISSAFAGGTIQATTRFSMDPTHYQNIVTLGFSNQSIGSINGVVPGVTPNSLGKPALGSISISDTLIAGAQARVDTISALQGAAAGIYTRLIGTRFGSQYVRLEERDKPLFSATALIASITAGSIPFAVTCPPGRQLTIKRLKVTPSAFGNYSSSITVETGSAIAGGAPALVPVKLINSKTGGTISAGIVVNSYSAAGAVLTGNIVLHSGFIACSIANNIHSEFVLDDLIGEIILTAGQILVIRSSALISFATQITAWITDEPA
jgi:hypothetical protein